MVIQARTFDLLHWLLPKAEKFPRLYRYTVTQRMMNIALSFQETLILAQTSQGRERLKHLRKCDALLQQLKFYLRLIHHWHWLSDGQYQHISLMVTEIGRLLGGWLKQSLAKKGTPTRR